MMDTSKKLFVIGLDCFDPTLVFTRWQEDLPCLTNLAARGIYGQLESTIPPITVPAWTCMLTGKDPGQQGFYGFRNREDHSYERMRIATANHVRFPRVWDRVSEAGGKVIVVGVPQTYPVKPLNGIMVSSFLTPSTTSTYTYPPAFKDEIAQVVGEYVLDVYNFRTEDKPRLLRDIYHLSEQRFDLIKHLLRTRRQWNLFMFVDMGPDRIHHGMWKYIDPQHPHYEAGNPYENSIHDYYRFIDTRVGELLDMLPEDATVIVMSDHGAQAMQGGICINDWLIEQGYLAVTDKPAGVTSLELCEIDWDRTKAWGAGGYYGRLHLNIQGREPQGVIPANQVTAFKQEIAAKLKAITDPQGKDIGTRIYDPEQVYAQANNIPPDLIIYFGDLAWRSIGTVGNPTIYVEENDAGPDGANHAQQGMYIMYQPLQPPGKRIAHSWRAVCPTMLEVLGLDVPLDMGEERLWQDTP